MSLSAPDREELRAAILAKWPSLYGFAKATGVTKSVVIQLLMGSYPGNCARQAQRVRDALEGAVPAKAARMVKASQIEEALASEACPRCKRQDRRHCKACHNLWARQAAAVLGIFSG